MPVRPRLNIPGETLVRVLGLPLLAVSLLVPPRACAQALLAEVPPGGEQFKVKDAQLFVPSGFQPGETAVPLTLHLHGFGAVEKSHVRAKQPGVLVSLSLNGLSSVYRERFREPEAFPTLLEAITDKLREHFGKPDLKVGSVTLTSFSAGFGGVREILKHEGPFRRIDTLIMADSIYAGFTGDPEKREVDPANMEGFLRFAREASTGRKRFLLTHTQLHTPTYASTVETADYLLQALDGKRDAADEAWPADLQLIGKWRKGGFEVLSFAGDDGPAHMKHLRGIWVFFERIGKP